ncbi:MAG: flagellar biosynthetic protein FliR [Desulfobulbaceae bacterium]|nr:flagellar biosynthetic protein FliR [Desulfobulbaceae bacterium]
MNIGLFPLEQYQVFLICAVRAAALITAIPVFNTRPVPPQARIGLIFTITLLLFPLMKDVLIQQSYTLLELSFIIINEALLGILLGLVSQLIFTAVSFGGTIIGYQMGFAAANIFDPQTTQQLSLISKFQNILALLIFLSLNGHHLFFRLIVESFTILPPGGMDFSGAIGPLIIDLSAKMFLLGLKFSAPVLAILLLSNGVLGIMARVFPQLNVFLLSFPINISISFLVIGLTINITIRILSREFDNLMVNIIHIFELL